MATVLKLRKTWQLNVQTNVRVVGKNENLQIGAKIFFIMGINWFFEILSFMLGWLDHDSTLVESIFFASDAFNLLQGETGNYL